MSRNGIESLPLKKEVSESRNLCKKKFFFTQSIKIRAQIEFGHKKYSFCRELAELAKKVSTLRNLMYKPSKKNLEDNRL